MAELKASEVKYSVPLVTKIGGVLFTATNVEFPASAEVITGGVELNLEKLGLADNAVLGNAEAAGPPATSGEVATTTALPIAAWTSGLAIEQLTAGESKTAIKKALNVTITINANKLFLRFFETKTANKVMLEVLTAEKATSGLMALSGCTVFVLGK
jgi:hypothetical protein